MRLAFKAGLAVLVLLGATYLFVFPAQTYLAQKTQIAAQERTISVLSGENSKLASQSSALQDDATIAELARQDYGLVEPGQQAFMVLPSPHQVVRTATRVVSHRHWYSSLELWRRL